jgi:hypothetical protein
MTFLEILPLAFVMIAGLQIISEVVLVFFTVITINSLAGG